MRVTVRGILIPYLLNLPRYPILNIHRAEGWINPRYYHITTRNPHDMTRSSMSTTMTSPSSNMIWKTCPSLITMLSEDNADTSEDSLESIGYEHTAAREQWKPRLNPRVQSLKVSQTIEILGMVKEMQAKGINVTSLCVGEPDFAPPQAVLDATTKALIDGNTRYTDVRGTAELREAISDDLYKRKGVLYDASQILVGNGAKQCVYQGVFSTCGEGDLVVIPTPCWPSYPEMVALTGAKSVLLPTHEKDGYLLTPDALRECLEERSHTNVKLLILCNPSNPTGAVHDETRLRELATVLQDHPNVAVIADEIYERLVYSSSDNVLRHTCFASLSPAMYERTMTINGFSKAYAMTGMRLGYMAAPAHFLKPAKAIQSQLTSCAGSISQAAGVAALRDVKEEEMDRNVSIMKKKRDYVIKRLNGMDHVKLSVVPTGAFYILPDVSWYCKNIQGQKKDDVEFCRELLQMKRLALVPGTAFGAPGTVRVSYATSLNELEVAMDKLEEFLLEYMSSQVTC